MNNKPKRLHPPHTPNYHDKIAERNPNRAFRYIASNVASGFAQLFFGKLVICDIPTATTDYDGPAIFVGVHRSKRDIPDHIKMINKAGFNSARPMAKEEWFVNRLKAAALHRLGAMAIANKSQGGSRGPVRASKTMMEKLQNPFIYEEKSRIKENTRRIAKIVGASILIAAETGYPIIVVATAGSSVDDKKRPLGFNVPVVGVMSEPMYFNPVEGQSANGVRKENVGMLYDVMQSKLDEAYIARDTLMGLAPR